MKKILKSLLFITIVAPSGLTHAQMACADIWNPTKKSTIVFGLQTPEGSVPQNLRLFVWNIHKGMDAQLPKDFAAVAPNADLVLFQEAVSEKKFARALAKANPTLGWTMAKSFELSPHNFTGVATASHVKPLTEEVIYSDVTEPISNTPKTILVSQFSIEGRTDTLMVANIHAINFVPNWDFKIQIRQLIDAVYMHSGPLIVAGDFNTWNAGRLEYLKKAFAPLGLRLLKTPVTPTFFQLDHVFVRGMLPGEISDLSQVGSSDHTPLMLELNLEPQYQKEMTYEDFE